jgi:hypothetical protein
MKKRILLILLCACATTARAQFLGQQSVSRSSYVIDKNGHLWVSGWNIYGQLGTGDKTDRSSFVQIPVPQGASRWTMVAGGGSHAVAVADSDKLYVWGSNRYGQLGLGLPITSVIPIRVTNPEGVRNWKWVSAGEDHTMALSAEGRLYTWGNNDRGQLGSGNRNQIPYPQQVWPGDSAVAWAAIAAGPGYTVALSTYGQLYTWGADTSGFIHSALAPNRASRTRFLVRSPLATLGAGVVRQSCVQQDGYFARFAVHEKLTTINDLLVASVADGSAHSLMIQPTGVLLAAGENEHGQLGQGDTLPRRGYNRPQYAVSISFPKGVTQFVAVAGGMNYSLALGNDGWLYGWGDNGHGELGLGGVPFVTRPTKLMQIGDSLRMNAGFVAPSFDGIPVSATLTVRNLSSSSTVAPMATLIPCDPLSNDDTLNTKTLVPNTLAAGASGTTAWSIESQQYYAEPDFFGSIHHFNGPYYAYISAPGSAPYLALSYLDVLPLNGKPIHDEVAGTVIDSITHEAIANALVNNVVRTDSLGRYALVLSQYNKYGTYACKENYGSDFFTFFPFPDGDTISALLLGPSPIQGFFQNIGDLQASQKVFKVFYPDSLIGFALSPTTIWRTTDSGLHWVSVHSIPFANSYNDFRFVNPRVGVAVGTSGTISETYDGGDTWTDVTPITTNNLSSIRFISRDTVSVFPGPIDRYNGVWKSPGRFYGFPTGSWDSITLVGRVIVRALDSGKSWISYDGSPHAPLDELTGHARAVMFYGPFGHLIHDELPMNYAGHAAPNSGIVWGHVTFNDSLTGIRNAKITRTYNVRNGITFDSTYTDELGNFLWLAIDSFHYNYKLTYIDDSGRSKSYTWKDISVKNGKTVKLVYSDPAPIVPPPPPPDTNKLIVSGSELSESSLRVDREGGAVYAVVSVPSGRCELALYDLMGRKLAEIPCIAGINRRIPLETAELSNGTYYLRLVTAQERLQARFSVVK